MKIQEAIYIRTSTHEQDPKNQLNDCLKLLKTENYKIFEEQQSAWKSENNRTVFEDLKKLLKTQSCTDLIVWDLDRIFRNRKKLIEFFRYCKYYNVKVHSFRQDWLEELNKIQEPFNEIMHTLMLEIMGWLAEEESNKKSERVRAALVKRRGRTYSKGGKIWGRKPIHTNKKKIVWSLREEGLSLRSIAEKTKLSLGSVSSICSEKK